MLNRCSMIGRVAREPQIKETTAGKTMVTFDLIVRERSSTGEPNARPTNIENVFRVVVINDALADVAARVVRKGTTLFIEGRLENRKFLLGDGTEATISEIVLGHQRAQMLVQNRYGEMSENSAKVHESALSA